MAASDSLFDSRGTFSGSSYLMKAAEIKGSRDRCLSDVAMASNFGTTLAVDGLRREITT